ncbi:MAG: TVP38/TMEM64 family protein [Chthoniobacterales bacterium]
MKEALRSTATWKWALVGLLLIGVIVAARVFPLVDWVKAFAEWAGHLGLLGALLYGVIFGLISMLMLPSLPFTIVAGFAFGMVNGTISIMLGIAIGASLGFLVARYAARGVVAQKIAANRRFSLIDRAIATDGWKIVGLLRLCPVPFGISNYLYGLTAIDFWRYMGASLLGMLPGCVAFVYLGAFGKQTIEGGRNPVQYVLGGLTVVALIGVTWMLGRIARRAAGTEFEKPNAAA